MESTEPTPAPGPSAALPSWLLPLVAAAAVAALGVFFSRAYLGNVVDDALISFRYAQNLAGGEGLVFNPGERVEGYTNFLWTLALAGLYAFTGGPGAFVPWAVGFSVACAVGSVWLVWLLGRRVWGGAAVPAAVALALVVADNAYLVWSVQALEGHFLVCWMLLCLWLADARPRGWAIGLGLCAAAVQMTRWDGFLLPLALGASYLPVVLARALRREAGAAQLLRGWGVVVAVGAVVYGAYFVWRYVYYGALLPNTFYLKVGGESFDAWARGAAYLQGYLAHRLWLPAAVVVLALATLRHPLLRALWLFVVAHAIYVVWAGGDFYPGHRFFVVATPAVAILAGAVVHGGWQLLGRLPRWQLAARGGLAVACAVAVVLVARLGWVDGPYRHEIRRWAEHVQRVRAFNEWMRGYRAPGDVVAVGDIGAAGFYADIPVIDVYGLVDPEIARMPVADFGKGKAGHEKWASRAYVLEKRPRFIRDGYVRGDLARDGYYLTGDVPAALSADWLWVRDELPGDGAFLEHTRFSFDRADPAWEATGAAFAGWPARSHAEGQQRVTGARRAFINTFVKGRGDRATGTLRSPPFALEGDLMLVHVGGGNDPERLRVSLVVDGEAVRSETGHDTEVLTRRVWDITPWKGRVATLEIVDEATGRWGHLLVDEVVQWSARSPAATALAE